MIAGSFEHRIELEKLLLAAIIVFLRVCNIRFDCWMTGLLPFVFLHADSEYASKPFSVQESLLLACDYHLERRLNSHEEQTATHSP